ncbi:MAG: GGDEF domain-containing protein, partial [Gemmatimonadota bacterium]
EQLEVERLQSINQRWAQLAGTDRLTGLPNKVAFLQALVPQQLQQAQRQAGSVGAILLSADNIGPINETHGRDAGDQVIRSLALLLQEQVKGEELLGHIDGTNFGVFLHAASPEAARQRAEELRGQVAAQVFTCGGDALRLTVSAGTDSLATAAIGDDPHQTAAAIFQRLNAALYAAKRAGGNRVESAPAAA